MNTAVIVALISGICTLAGTIITVIAGIRKTAHNAEIRQAVTDTKLEELTRQIRTHNDFGRRIPVIEEQIKVINHRIADLEEKQ